MNGAGSVTISMEGAPHVLYNDDNFLARHLLAVTSVAIWGLIFDQRERGPAFRLRAHKEAGWPVSAETNLASIPAISARIDKKLPRHAIHV